MQELKGVQVLKQTDNHPLPVLNDHTINFLLISDDKDDVMTLVNEFRNDKIANPLFIENNDIGALNLIKQKDSEENSILNTWIILLDINSPTANGFKILKKLQAEVKFQNLKVFVMTSSHEVKAQIEAANYQVSGYIGKPISFDKFASAISVLNYKWHLTDEQI
jgi:DNA-binding NarL/FixJ family response regulator